MASDHRERGGHPLGICGQLPSLTTQRRSAAETDGAEDVQKTNIRFVVSANWNESDLQKIIKRRSIDAPHHF